MNQYTQGLLALGTIAVVGGLAVPNIKASVIGYGNILHPSVAKRRVVDKSRIKSYLTWVIGLSVTCGLYNLAVTRNLALLGEATGTDAFFLAVGLVTVVLKTDQKGQTKK